MAAPATSVADSTSAASGPQDSSFPGARQATEARHLLMPREHGAWGLVSLPFLAGAIVAGGWANWQTLAALLVVLSVFLLRAPLLVFWRAAADKAAARKAGASAHGRAAGTARRQEFDQARISVFVYASLAAAAGLYLLDHLPAVPLMLLGGGAALLTVASLYFTVRKYQRHAALQICSVMGLTSSSLLAYLAARGELDGPAFWIWGLSAAHGSASVLVVHARLESIVTARKPGPAPTPQLRHALLAQAGLGLLLAGLAAGGQPWLILPFLPPSVLHGWELWRLRSGKAPRVSLRRVGLLQLGTSLAFCFLLIAVLR